MPPPHEPDHDTVLQPPAGLRLHLRRSADPDGADGRRRQRGDRLDGQRRRPGRALGAAAAALQLLQAALRPGHQSAGRLHPRRDHHVDGDDHRPRVQPARADAALGPADQVCNRRSSRTTSWTSSASSKASRPGSFKSLTLPILFNPTEGGATGWNGPSTALCKQASQRRRHRARLHHPVRPRRRSRTTRPSRRCWPWPACIIT